MVWNYHCCRNTTCYLLHNALVKAGLHKDTLVDIIFIVHYLDLSRHESIL